MDVSTLATRLASNDLFRDADSTILGALVAELEPVHLAAGTPLFHQGDAGDSMYMLLQGRLAVSIRYPDGSVAQVDELSPGASVGEMALLTGQPCVATVVALEDAELVRLPRAGFERLAEQSPQVVADFARRMLPRFRRSLLAGILTDLFGELDTAAIHEIETDVRWHRVASGEVLFRQGDAADGMFVVVSGRLRIAAATVDGAERVIDESGAGETVGEFALLTDDSRSATVYAVRDSDVVYFSRVLFERLADRYPRLLLQMTRRLIARSKRSAALPDATPTAATTFALVPAGQASPLTAVAPELAEELRKVGPTLHLNADRLDRAYGRAGAAQTTAHQPVDIALTAWLSEQEHRYRYIIYEADPAWSPWTQRCLRQADRVVLVADATTTPALGPVEQAIAGRPAHGVNQRTDLVLVHPPGHSPSKTGEWLRLRRATMHHHIRRDDQADVARLGRLLTGRGVGLALGGGGARGFAHIGVVRALREVNIPIDVVGGTSIGACIGAQIAMGIDWRKMVEFNRRGFVDMHPATDYTLPLVSMLDARRLGNVLAFLYGDAMIEDLWLNYICVSSNLTRGEAVVHAAGPVRKYVRASMSIPGVVPPVPDAGSLLVDGGVMNTLPADLVRQLYGGTVIAVDVTPRIDLVAGVDYGERLSGWYAAWRALKPFGPRLRVPNIHAILERTTVLASVQRAAALASGGADVYIHPPVDHFGSFAVKAIDQIVDAGYRAAQEPLAAWMAGRSV